MKAQRICIIGNSGSGKSTLATRLSQKYNLPVFHLDRELLHGQFETYPLEETRRRHNKIIAKDKWIIDGSYRKLIPERLARADLVIYLNIPRWKVIHRVYQRTNRPAESSLGVPKEAKPAYSFNLFRYQLKYNRRRKLRDLKKMMADYPNLKLIILNSASPEEWVKSIT